MDDTLTMPSELIGVTLDDGLQHFDRVEPVAHFTLPARLTVKRQLEYFSRYSDTRFEPMYLRLWHSAIVLIQDWQCDVLPDPKVDLDKITDTQATTVIMWAGNLVLGYMNELEALPKV